MIDDFQRPPPSRRQKPASARPATRPSGAVSKPRLGAVAAKKAFQDFGVRAQQPTRKPVAKVAKPAARASARTVGDFVVIKEINTQSKTVKSKIKNEVQKTSKVVARPLAEPELPKKVLVEKHVISQPAEGSGKQPRSVTLALSLFLFILFVAPTGLVLRHWLVDKQQDQAQAQTNQDIAEQAVPFTPLYPAGLASQASDTPTYDFSEKTLRYTDRVGDVPVAISQQALAENFRSDATGAEFEKFAKAEGANRTLKAGAYTFYLGAKRGAVNLIHFTDQKVMVTITAQTDIDTILWTEYLATFQPEVALE